MISVENAKELIVKSTNLLSPILQDITKSLNQVLAEDIYSAISYPPFDQSAMDGFAIQYSDIVENNTIKIIGEAPAGSPYKEVISSGQAVRIFTGGEIPTGADTVIMQEKVSIENEKLAWNHPMIFKGEHIRKKGLQIKEGDIALKKETVLNPGAIGFLAGLGITKVNVFPKPRVSVIVTGNELQKPGTPLESGQVYESNSFALHAALESINVHPINTLTIGDDENITKTSLSIAIEKSDLVLVSGGISVGEYDFVGKCLEDLGVENIFYKIAQKPGKPIYFGKKGNCLVFGLPGNPASALSCFYEYVYPAIKISQGFSDVFLRKLNFPILSDYNKKEGISLFLKGKISEGSVEVLSGQESNNIGSFALANCIIYLPMEKGNVAAGEYVEVHILPD